MTAELQLYQTDYSAWAERSVSSTVMALRRSSDADVIGVWRAIKKERKPIVWAVMDEPMRERIRRITSANK